MTNKTVLLRTGEFVREKLSGEGSGHDWWHVVRVANNAKVIAGKEGGDLFVVELAALLHDIADWKFHDGDTTVGPRVTREWLAGQKVGGEIIEQVAYIVEHISFRGGTNKHVMKTLEGKIVQDADRLDALGAIGVARAGAAQQEMYNPGTAARKSYESFEQFRASMDSNTAINHFYEKLFLLKDRMNTTTGKELAKERHEFMETYLERFYAEWEGRE